MLCGILNSLFWMLSFYTSTKLDIECDTKGIELRSWKQHRIFNIYQNFFSWWFWSLFRIQRIFFPVLQIFFHRIFNFYKIQSGHDSANNSLVIKKKFLSLDFSLTIHIYYQSSIHAQICVISVILIPKIIQYCDDFAPLPFNFSTFDLLCYISFIIVTRLWSFMIYYFCNIAILSVVLNLYSSLYHSFFFSFFLCIIFMQLWYVNFFCSSLNVWLTVKSLNFFKTEFQRQFTL